MFSALAMRKNMSARKFVHLLFDNNALPTWRQSRSFCFTMHASPSNTSTDKKLLTSGGTAHFPHLCRFSARGQPHEGKNGEDPQEEVCDGRFIPLSRLSPSEIGPSILRMKANGSAPEQTQTDLTRRTIVFAKFCSFGSSSIGLVMIPALSSFFWEAAMESPGMACFLTVVNGFLGLLTFTPLLLHFLVKRFVVDLHYNPETKIFTSVHYNIFMGRRALRFRSSDVLDVAKAPKKLTFPLATCFIHGRPLLLNLDPKEYNNPQAFLELTNQIDLEAIAELQRISDKNRPENEN